MSFTITPRSAELHAPRQPRCVTVAAPSAGARIRLICFSRAGGGPSTYVPWARALADHPVEIAAASLPGFSLRRFEGDHFYLNRTLDALLADITSQLQPLL